MTAETPALIPSLSRVRRALLGDALRRQAQHQPARAAMIGWDSGGQRVEMTYVELDHLANRVAHLYRSLGVEPGQRIAVMGHNSVWFAVAYWGAQRAGAVFCPLSPALTIPELQFQLEHAEPTLIVVEEGSAPLVEQATTQLKAEGNTAGPAGSEPPHIVTFANDGGALAMQASSRSEEEPSLNRGQDDVALLVYTSGTESRPKGVMLTHGNFLSSTSPTWVYSDYVRPADTFLLMAPMYTMAGVGTLTTLHTIGATVVTVGSTDPDPLLDVIEREHVSNLSQTPAFYARMVDSPSFSSANLESLRHCHTYGGLISRDVIERFRVAGPNVLWATYWGQSELTQLGSVGYFRSLDDVPEGDLRWIGRPMAHLEVRVVDAEGKDVATGEEGELVCRSPSAMAGYYRDPQKTEEVVDEGWLHTGDLVRQDAAGNLFFHDRKKDVIKSGGMNVSSLEVEAVIDALPGVREVAVIGVPDERWSEAVTAFVVPGEGAPDEAEIRASCRRVLAAYKTPKRVIFVDSLPRDPQGKVRKRLLRDATLPSSGGHNNQLDHTRA